MSCPHFVHARSKAVTAIYNVPVSVWVSFWHNVKVSKHFQICCFNHRSFAPGAPFPLPCLSSISAPSNGKLLLYETLSLNVNIGSNKASKVNFFEEYGKTGNIKETFNDSFLILELVLSMYSEMETIYENILTFFISPWEMVLEEH